MPRIILSVAGVIAVLSGSACDSASPPPGPAPTSVVAGLEPVPLPPSPPPPPADVEVTGLVQEHDDRPVAGVNVQFWGLPPVAAVTDEGGRYALTLHTSYRGDDPTISKDGYEPSRHHVRFESATAVPIRAYPIVRIRPGESVRIDTHSVWNGGPVCGHEMIYACRAVRVHSVAAGRLMLDVSPAGSTLSAAIGSFGPGDPDWLGSTYSLDVTADSETKVVVLFDGDWGDPASLSAVMTAWIDTPP